MPNKYYKMENDNGVMDELKNLGARIPLNPHPNPPEGYFEKLPGEIINRWKKEESLSRPGTKLQHWIAIAAVITGLLIGGLLILKNEHPAQSITALEAYQYVDENIEEFESMIETLEINSVGYPSDIPQEALEEYLIEETEHSQPEDLF